MTVTVVPGALVPTYQIAGLTPFTTAPGNYVLTVDSSKIVDFANNTGSVTASVAWTEAQTSVNLAVTNTVDNPSPHEGSPVHFTITVNNLGATAATNLSVLDLLPGGLTLISASPSSGSYNTSSGLWSIGQVPAGGSVTLTLLATLNLGTGGQTLKTFASVTAVDQPNTGSTTPVERDVVVQQTASLTISNAASTPLVFENGTFNYLLTLTNAGPASATNVVVSDTLPTSLIPPAGPISGVVFAGNTFTWTIPSLPSGGTATLMIPVTVQPGTIDQTIADTATITGLDQYNPNAGNGSASASVSVRATVTSVVITGPSTRTSPVGSVAAPLVVTFTDPIAIGTLTSSAFALTLNGTTVPIPSNPPLGVTQTGPTTYQITGLDAVTGPVGNYVLTLNASLIQDAGGFAGTGSASATWTTIPSASSATNLAISPDTGVSSTDGVTATGSVTFSGQLASSGSTVAVFDTTTNTDLGNATVVGTSFSLPLSLAEGSHVLRARVALNGTTADAFEAVRVDLTGPTSLVTNSLGLSQTANSFPVKVSFADPGGASSTGVTSIDLYVSANNGPFTLAQTLNFAPAASGTATFTFAGLDRNLYAFHAVAHDLAGNVEAKPSSVIEASTSVPDLNPPVTHVLSSSPSYSFAPFPASNFSGLAPSSYANGVFTLRWAGADPDQSSGTPPGSIAKVNIYAVIDNSSFILIGQPAGGTPDANGVYSGTLTYQAQADGVAHTYAFYSVGVDDQQKKQYAPQGGPASPDVTFANITYNAPFGIQQFNVQEGIAGRSYIRYLDVNFNQGGTPLQTLAAGIAGPNANSFVELLWYGEGLNANSIPQGSVNLFNGSTASVVVAGHDLSIDFGPNGLTSLLTENGVAGTGSPSKAFGDGWYALAIDPTGNPSNHQVYWLTFFRLLGDIDGDGVVTGPYTAAGTDAALVYNAQGQTGVLLNSDVDGSGAVNSKDLTYTVGAKGHAVGSTPPTNFPQFQLIDGNTGRPGPSLVTQEQVQALLPLAVDAWSAAGLDPADVRKLKGAQVRVADLGGSILGFEAAGVIEINQTAAGSSWYLDAATGDAPLFGLSGPGGERIAGLGSPAAGRIDLLTVLEHELGHIVGLPDNATPGDLMDITIGAGVRRSPTAADVARVARGSSLATGLAPSALSAPTPWAIVPIGPGLAPSGFDAPTGTLLSGDMRPLSRPSSATIDAALESIVGMADPSGDNPKPVASPTPASSSGSPVAVIGRTKAGKARIIQAATPHPTPLTTATTSKKAPRPSL